MKKPIFFTFLSIFFIILPISVSACFLGFGSDCGVIKTILLNPESLINYTGFNITQTLFQTINNITQNITNNITNNITTSELEPQYNSNPLGYRNDTNAYNSSYALNSTLSAYDSKLSSFTELNTPYYTNPLGYRNDTNAINSSYALNSTLSAYDTKPNNVYNSSYALNSTLSAYDSKPSNTFNSTYDAKVSFVNNTAYNTTTLNASVGIVTPKICFIETCLKNITWNGTNIIIYG